MAESQTRVLLTQVLYGLRGMGKTQLAAAYARQAWQAGELDILVWTTAKSRNSIQACYAQVAAEIGHLSPVDVEQAAKWFLGFLQTTTRSWLVVLDDLRDPTELQDLWPVGPSGRMLVTTPRRAAVLARHDWQLIEVGPYTRSEALAYLHEKIASSDDHRLEQIAGLAIDLRYLPLALAQAAAFISDRRDTCAGYRRRLRDQRQLLSDVLSVDTPADDYRFTVAATRAIAVELADLFAPVGLAQPTLQLASVLDPNGAPADIFTTRAVLTFIGKYRQFLSFEGDDPRVDHQDGIDALDNLQHLNLLSFDQTADRRVVRTHELVQHASLEQLPEDVLAITVRAAADAIMELWPDIEREIDLGRALRDCALALKERYSTLLWIPDGHPILFRAGRSLGECGLVSASVNYWADMEAQAADLLGSDHPDTLIALGNLAYWRSQASDAAGAAAAFEQLLSDYLRALGPDHVATLSTRGNLAYWRGEAGDPAVAAAAFEQLVADYLRVLGPDHPDTLTTRSNLARWRGEAGDPAAAAAAFEQLLTDRLRLLGPDHPYVLTTRNNLAQWRGEAGDPAGAAAALERLVADHLRVMGPDHPHTLTTRSNLAYWSDEAAER
ncbi:MAG: tetratricopeptide repeat protein [Pseudonocardiaceae bacterium]